MTGAARTRRPRPEPQTDIALDLPGVSSTMQAGSKWFTVYGDAPVVCTAQITVTPPDALVTVVVTLSGAHAGPVTDHKEGIGHAKISVRIPSVWDESPTEFECYADYTVNGRAINPRIARLNSSPFWGAYDRDAFDYDTVIYFPKPGCVHSGMFSNSLAMQNPAPGYPNVGNPPLHMQDEGFMVFAAGFSPLHMHFFLPSDNPAYCQAAQ